MLLRPWRDLKEVKSEHRTWKEEYALFIETTTKRECDVLAGLQFYYDSKSTAKGHDDDIDDHGDHEIRMDIDSGNVEDIENDDDVRIIKNYDVAFFI